jgi:hypothetical protein
MLIFYLTNIILKIIKLIIYLIKWIEIIFFVFFLFIINLKLIRRNNICWLILIYYWMINTKIQSLNQIRLIHTIIINKWTLLITRIYLRMSKLIYKSSVNLLVCIIFTFIVDEWKCRLDLLLINELIQSIIDFFFL